MSRYLDKKLVDETYRGRLDRVEDLLDKGANIDRLASDGFTPLMRAAYGGHHDVVQILLQRGADPNATAKDGASALFWACVRRHEDVAELLIAAGADVNASRGALPPRRTRRCGFSVLGVAIESASVEFVRRLIDAGASVEKWFLESAERHGRQDLIPLLQRKGPRRKAEAMDDFSDILQLPITAVRERIEQELVENPVLELRCSEAPDNETADLIVDRSGAGSYDLRLSDHRSSDLFVSQRYSEMCQDPAADARTKEFLDRKLRRARCLLEAVERRREILQRVAEAIFRQQGAFFDHGPSHIAALYVEQVAGEVGVDTFKVLRAIQGKQVRTRHGVFALDRFVLRQPTPSSN